MSYQVLARKWRPRNFETLLGQEHVARVLINALSQQRLHHAYLFTGTRGVGKTTIARILAKCLNCETGITANPCGQCSACQEIDEGRFVDLIEVDAASRTKVEDTRELLSNVQYMPTRGRFKIYLIDEVHMLSGHSFNALLKTLEEPPPHIKFLLATTDPQKLPATILSRCLQFHLKNLPAESIDHYLQQILQKEVISFDSAAIRQISEAANGSMRDALSILDQAISFGHGEVKNTDVTQMLGTIQHTDIQDLLSALAIQDGKQLLKISGRLAENGADFSAVLESLIATLYHIALAQVIPDALNEYVPHAEIIQKLSQQFSPEEIQLYYQMVLLGRRDLPLAHHPRIGFEMLLLRLLAFHPHNTTQPTKKIQSIQPIPKDATIKNDNEWIHLLSQLNLNGMVYALASNCALESFTDNHMILILDHSHAALLNEKLQSRLNEALNNLFTKPIHLTIQIKKLAGETLAKRHLQELNQKQKTAIESIQTDPIVQALVEKFDAVVETNLIKPDSD